MKCGTKIILLALMQDNKMNHDFRSSVLAWQANNVFVSVIALYASVSQSVK